MRGIVFKSFEKVWSVSLGAEFGHADVTGDVEAVVANSEVTTGIVVTTIEYESGALSDLRTALDRIAPTSAVYQHDERWGDGNGFSHVRSALLKTSVAIPIIGGRPALGTWQQVVVINLDNRARNREVVAVVVGE